MPWIARYGEHRVIPEEVDNGERVICIDCGKEMYPRGPMSDGRARHFVHSSNSNCDGGNGGESDKHRKLKSLAVSGLRQRFDSEFSLCAPEVSLDVTQTETEIETRRADAFLEFLEPHDLLGDGLIVEVQYRNIGKDVESTTYDYLSLGYSVFWATPDDFGRDRFHINELSERVISPVGSNPEEFLSISASSSSISSKTQNESMVKGTGHPIPEFLDCNHMFFEVKESIRMFREHRCSECGVIFHKIDGVGYMSMNRFDFPNINDLAEECGDVWRYDDESYYCVNCGEPASKFTD